jgi:bifunctional N6-L-threonylcarbamoyladenine synthase / protein kinase Bud32
MSTIIAQGAEATIYKESNTIIKVRAKKSYRLEELDNKIRRARTRREAKVLEKIKDLHFTPVLYKTNNKDSIEMEYVPGPKVACCLEERDYKDIAKKIGNQIKQLHEMGIIHGDLTTSNMILTSKNEEVFFIDFGLSFFSEKIEDKAVDLHVLGEALYAKHHTIAKEVFQIIIGSYNDKDVLQRLAQVEKRGKNKKK